MNKTFHPIIAIGIATVQTVSCVLFWEQALFVANALFLVRCFFLMIGAPVALIVAMVIERLVIGALRRVQILSDHLTPLPGVDLFLQRDRRAQCAEIRWAKVVAVVGMTMLALVNIVFWLELFVSRGSPWYLYPLPLLCAAMIELYRFFARKSID